MDNFMYYKCSLSINIDCEILMYEKKLPLLHTDIFSYKNKMPESNHKLLDYVKNL